jgi:hypothetical protein
MMTTVYSDADFDAVYDQRRKAFRIFIGATIFYVVYCAIWLTYFISLPYNHPMQNFVKAVVFVASTVYVVFEFVFMGIKYHRVNRYYKMMFYLSEGIKVVEENYFVGFAKKDLPKDGVDVYSCLFRTWNKKKCEWMEREVYIDAEQDIPDFEQGDLVRYITQSNFLLRYEVKKRGVPEEEQQASGV